MDPCGWLFQADSREACESLPHKDSVDLLKGISEESIHNKSLQKEGNGYHHGSLGNRDHHGSLGNRDHNESLGSGDHHESPGNADHDKTFPKGDSADPYKLNWPGLISLPVYIIDPNTKTVYEPSNPLPTSQTGLNCVEYKYVKVQSIIDLFNTDCRLRALDTLIHLSSLYDLHKFHTVAKVGYMHIGTLLAFLVVYPWCDSFQKARGTVLQFLIRYIEGQCWLCGFVRRDCRCGKSIYDAEVVQVSHQVDCADKGVQVEPSNTGCSVGNPMSVLLPGGAHMQPGMRVPMSSLCFSSDNPMQMATQFSAGMSAGMLTIQNNGMPRPSTGMYQVPSPQINYLPGSANPVTGPDSVVERSEASSITTATRFSPGMHHNPGWDGPFAPNPAACMWTMGNGPQYGAYSPVMSTTQLNNPGFLSPPQQVLPSKLMPPPYQTPPSTGAPGSSTDSPIYMKSIVRPGTRMVMPGTTGSGMVPGGMSVPYPPLTPPVTQAAKKVFVKNMSTQTRPVAREKRCKGTNYMMSTVKRKSLDDGDNPAGNESEAKKVKGSETGDVADGEKTPIRTFTEQQLWRLIEEEEDEAEDEEGKKSGESSLSSGSASLDHLKSGSASPDHLKSGSALLDHLKSGSASLDHLKSGSASPDHLKSGSALLDHLKSGSASPDHLKSGSASLDHLKSGSASPDHLKSGSALLDHLKSGSALLDHIENADETAAEAICRRIVEDIVGSILGKTSKTKQVDRVEAVHVASTSGGNANNEVHSSEKSTDNETTNDKSKDACHASSQRMYYRVTDDRSDGKCTREGGQLDREPWYCFRNKHCKTDTSGSREDSIGVNPGDGMEKMETTPLEGNTKSFVKDFPTRIEMQASGDATSSEKGLGVKPLSDIASLCGQIVGGDTNSGVSNHDFKRLNLSSDGKQEVSSENVSGKVGDSCSAKKVGESESNRTDVGYGDVDSHKKHSEDPEKKTPVQTTDIIRDHSNSMVTETKKSAASSKTSIRTIANVAPSLAVVTCENKRKACYAKFEYIPTGEKMFRCMYQQGGQCFDNRQAAEMHNRAHRFDGNSCRTNLYCHLCDYAVTCTHWYDLLRHLKCQHYVMLTTKQYGCTLCGISFENEEELSSHLEFHYNSRFKCIYCGMLLTTWKHVQQHITNECMDVKKTADAIYYLGCPYCPLVFHKKTIKKIHTLSHQDTGLVCIFCRDDSPWDVWRQLRKHYHQRHAKKLLGNISLLNPPEKYRRPKCHFCQMEFRLQDDFKLHMVKTHDLVPYVSVECDLCQKVYRNEKVRDRHVKKVHVEDLKCNKCTFIAKTPLLLKVHQKAEHVERPHMCSECDRTFVSYRELKVHMVRHATRSIHLCKTCGIELSSFAELKRHKLKEHPTMATMSGPTAGRDAIICPECNYRCYSRIALGKHLKKLHPDQELVGDDPDHCYFNSTTTPPPVAKRQKVVPVTHPIKTKKPPYGTKPLPLKLTKGKKKKLVNGKGQKRLTEKGVKLRRLKRFGCARLRSIIDYHREKRQREAEELMNITIPAGSGARCCGSSKQNREAASTVDLDHCYSKVKEPSVYTTRVRIENDNRLKLTVVTTPASTSSAVVPANGDDKMDATAGSDTISARSTPSPDGAALNMQDSILEGASRLVSMLRQQMESGEIGQDLANLLPATQGTMSADIHDEGIVGLDLMDDDGNIEQQLTDILDSMQQETSPGGASSQHTKTTVDAPVSFSDNSATDAANLESAMEPQPCDVVAVHTTLTCEGDVGEEYGMDVDEIELGEADYQLWQENHNSGANIEVQNGSTNLPDSTSCNRTTVMGLSDNCDSNSGDDSGDDDRHAISDSCVDKGISGASEKQQQPCLVDHQYY